jgi:hypothetical protein
MFRGRKPVPPVARALMCGFTLVILVASGTLAQRPNPPDSVLRAITSRGRELVAYDIAAWHGSDAITALGVPERDLSASIARRDSTGKWELLVGRLSPARDTFFVLYRAIQHSDSTFTAMRESHPVPFTGAERAMAVAIDTVQRQVRPGPRPYNSYVITADHGYWVFLMPAQTDPGIFPHGGDWRARVQDGRIVALSRLHNTILDRTTPPPNAVTMAHTSFDTLPSETDVFMVLRRAPRLSELVVTSSTDFTIDTTGRIVAAPKAAPGTAPRVWTARVDTVGSARRVLSPGYTRWRDSTTGWSIQEIRTIDIGAAPNSQAQNRRAALLADGRVVVSQRLPATVTLFDTLGHAVRTLGREGIGPNDYGTDITVAATHDTIVVNDLGQGRIVLFDTTGRVLGGTRTGIHSSVMRIDQRGRIEFLEETMATGTAGARYVYYSMDGRRIDSTGTAVVATPDAVRIPLGNSVANIPVPFAATPSWAVLPNGAMISGRTDRFEFTVTRTGRDTLLLFGRSDVRSMPLDTSAFREALQSMTRQLSIPDSLTRQMPRPLNWPLWTDVTVDNAGYVWVVVQDPVNHGFYYSIFSQAGYYLGYVRGYFSTFNGVMWQGDRAVWIGYDAQRRPIVRVYQVNRRGMAGGS